MPDGIIHNFPVNKSNKENDNWVVLWSEKGEWNKVSYIFAKYLFLITFTIR